jgi:hypothetical protein
VAWVGSLSNTMHRKFVDLMYDDVSNVRKHGERIIEFIEN